MWAVLSWFYWKHKFYYTLNSIVEFHSKELDNPYSSSIFLLRFKILLISGYEVWIISVNQPQFQGDLRNNSLISLYHACLNLASHLSPESKLKWEKEFEWPAITQLATWQISLYKTQASEKWQNFSSKY